MQHFESVKVIDEPCSHWCALVRAGAVPCARRLTHGQAKLRGLQAAVEQSRNALAPDLAAGAIAAIGLDGLLPAPVHATPLERHWQRDDLRRINQCPLSPATRQRALQAGALAKQCCATVLSVLTAMLGRLAERGMLV